LQSSEQLHFLIAERVHRFLPRSFKRRQRALQKRIFPDVDRATSMRREDKGLGFYRVDGLFDAANY
jgi:hypothetical protein